MSAAQSAEAAKKLQQSQQARERNAREYLQANASKPGVSPISVIKTFCAKSDREVVEVCANSSDNGLPPFCAPYEHILVAYATATSL